jgi:hypothetical protein
VILTDPGARNRHGSRRRSIGRFVLVALVLILAFLVGIAFARTLDERPKAGGVVTSVRTLTPLPQRAATTQTVTVTVTTP